jgi:hypothetical protein
MNNEQTTVTYLGLGGHGWGSSREIIYSQNPSRQLQNLNREINFIQAPADHGGASGQLSRLLELSQNKLNKQIHGNVSAPIYPWGDYNKLVAFFIGQRHPECEASFLEKSSNINELINYFELFANCIKADRVFVNDFKDYIREIFEYASNSGFPLAKVSIAHFFNPFILNREGSMLKFNQYYQNLEILPRNCFLHFLTSSRIVLHGVDCNGNKLIGEDIIDDYKLPMTPKDYSLRKINGDLISREEIRDSLEIISNSDYVLFPNGSIANLFPIINIPEVKELLIPKGKDDRVIMLQNLFYKENELPNNVYVNYLTNNLGIDITVIGPMIETYVLNEKLLKAYEIQGKKASPMAIEKIAYHASLELEVSDGLKYTANSMYKALNRLLR